MTDRKMPDPSRRVKVEGNPREPFRLAYAAFLRARADIAIHECSSSDKPGVDEEMVALTEGADALLWDVIKSRVVTQDDILEKVRLAHEMAEDETVSGEWHDGRLVHLLSAIREDMRELWHEPRKDAA